MLEEHKSKHASTVADKKVFSNNCSVMLEEHKSKHTSTVADKKVFSIIVV